MGLTRREFVKLCMGSTMGAYLLSVLGPDFGNQIAFAADEKPVVIWLQGASCTGCSISLLNSVDPPIEKVLLDVISLRYHPNLMAASGHLCGELLEEIARDYKDRFVLVIEGAIPTKDNGIYCTIAENKNIELTMLQAVNVLGNAAAAVIAAGNCASFGGIPGATPNPTGCVAVNKVVTKKPVINISCCPFPPEHFLGTVVYYLTTNQVPELDRLGRPKMFYPKPIHEECWRRQYFDKGQFAQRPGDEGCLAMLGCKGFWAMADCNKRGWNNNVNWCIKAGAPCQACSEPLFPDESAPFYGLFPVTNKQGISYNEVVPRQTGFFEEPLRDRIRERKHGVE